MSTDQNDKRIFFFFGVGSAAGAAIAIVDNVMYGGEVSPIVIVALLLSATGAAGWAWGCKGWMASASVRVWIPLTHLIKHLLNLPDALHPNTSTSILMLAAFTLVVATVGTGCGNLLRRLTTKGSA